MNANGIEYLPDLLTRSQQEQLVEEIREIVAQAPLFTPEMPRTGKKMSVRMTNCGKLGWLTDQQKGYRYQATHPQTGKPWPPVPGIIMDLWDAHANYPAQPEACLINYYEPTAKMGLHQDKDEQNLDAPVLSISLGDSCLFRVGGTKRSDPTTSFRLNSGDIVLLSGKARLAFHGVERIYPGTSTLLKSDGRINLTLRVVNNPTL